MSRAFVKEPDAGAAPEPLPELPQSPHVNYVTPGGLAQLRRRLAEAQDREQALRQRPDDAEAAASLALVQRERRFLEGRLERAVPVDPAAQPADRVAFGATVEVATPQDERRRFTIVGEDEADAEHGRVSWVSPLARALLDAEVGDVVVWHRPAGDLELEILAIAYGDA